jgi:hypothetical protein
MNADESGTHQDVADFHRVAGGLSSVRERRISLTEARLHLTMLTTARALHAWVDRFATAAENAPAQWMSEDATSLTIAELRVLRMLHTCPSPRSPTNWSSHRTRSRARSPPSTRSLGQPIEQMPCAAPNTTGSSDGRSLDHISRPTQPLGVRPRTVPGRAWRPSEPGRCVHPESWGGTLIGHHRGLLILPEGVAPVHTVPVPPHGYRAQASAFAFRRSYSGCEMVPESSICCACAICSVGVAELATSRM